MSKLFAILLLFFNTITVSAQPEFSIAIKDYFWQKLEKTSVDLVILLKIKNTGTEAGADDEVNHLSLSCSQKEYLYGRDITFISIQNAITQFIEPGAYKLGYIIFNLPRDADNIKLKLPADSVDICMSYVNWAYYNNDEKLFLNEARMNSEKGNYSDALVNYLKALSVNQYLEIKSEIDTTLNLFKESEEALTYYDLFENVYKDLKKGSESLEIPDKTPKLSKLEGNVGFCESYTDNGPVGLSNSFRLGSNGCNITVLLKMNRASKSNKILLKIRKFYLVTYVTLTKSKYDVNPEADYLYFPNIHFSSEGTYKIIFYDRFGKKISSGVVSIIK
jgi:tetratricopeptide (TPR) repeat protein